MSSLLLCWVQARLLKISGSNLVTHNLNGHMYDNIFSGVWLSVDLRTNMKESGLSYVLKICYPFLGSIVNRIGGHTTT